MRDRRLRCPLILSITCLLLTSSLPSASAGLVWRFDKPNQFRGWKPEAFRKIKVSNRLKGTTNYLSFLHSPALALDADRYPIFSFRVKSSIPGPGSVYFKRRGEDLGESKKVSFNVIGDGRFHDYSMRMSDNPNWQGVIRGVRFDVIYSSGAEIEIERLAFLPDAKPQPNPGGLIRNGDFSHPRENGSNQPDEWQMTISPGGTSELVKLSNGNGVIRLSTTRAGAAPGIRQSVPLDYMGQYDIQLKARLEQFSRGDRIELTLQYRDIFGDPLEKSGFQLTEAPANAWGGMKATLSPPGRAASLDITLRLRSRSRKSMALLDNVSLQKVSDYQPKPAEFSGSPRPIVTRPATPPKARFETVGGTPSLIINGRRHTTMNYWCDEPDAADLIANCRDAGLHIYLLNIGNTPWKSDGSFDFSEVDAKCSKLLTRDPEAYVIFGVALDNQINKGLQPWLDAHPDEAVRDSNGSNTFPAYGGAPSKAPSMASRVWLQMAEDLIRGLIRHTHDASYCDRVIGYHPANGVTFEWQQWASVADPPIFVDYSEPARQALVEWAKREYADSADLNASWKTDYRTFDDITIPSKDDRCRTDLGDFLDPVKSRRETDFRRYYSELVADDIIRLAHVVKEETHGKSICGVYYGYVTHVLGPYRYQLIGHMALHKVLESPDLDYIMSPSDYGDRQIGGASGFMSVTDSVKLHGKVWIDQADLRTHHSTQALRVETLADSKAAMIRNFGNALVSGVSEQLYDFSWGWTSGDKRLMQVAARLRKIEQQTLDVGRNRTAEDSIALIVDEKSTYYTAMASLVHLETVTSQYSAFARTGVGFDMYLLDDLPMIPDHKCYVFLNTFRITTAQRALIDSNLKKNGKVLVFEQAPGITDENKLSPERVSEITGIRTEALTQETPLAVRMCNTTNPIAKYMQPEDVYGYGNPHGLVIIPTEGEVLGTLAGNPEKAGLVLKKDPDWTCVFSTSSGLSPKLLRGIAEYAGVRVTNPTDGDITYVGDRLICVHTLVGGPRRLRVDPATVKATELVMNRSYAVKNGAFEVNLPPRSTTIFLIR